MEAFFGRAVLTAIAALLSTQAARAESLDEHATRASCLITPFHIYKLAMPTAGPLASVAVKRADVVKKGQVIAQLESVVEQAQVDAARVRSTTDVAIRLKTAVYTAAAAKFDRQRKLRVAAVTSEQALEEAEAAASVAKEEIEQARLDKQLAALELVRLEATLDRRILRASRGRRRHVRRTSRGRIRRSHQPDSHRHRNRSAYGRCLPACQGILPCIDGHVRGDHPAGTAGRSARRHCDHEGPANRCRQRAILGPAPIAKPGWYDSGRGALQREIWEDDGPVGNSKMARETGLEPAASAVTGRRSNQLSYSRGCRNQCLIRAEART